MIEENIKNSPTPRNKREFDLRWILLPLISILAIVIGGANPWSIATAFIAGFQISLHY